MVPFAYVVTIGFEKVVLRVTNAVSPTVRWRGSRGKKTGEKVAILELKWPVVPKATALCMNYRFYWLFMNLKAVILASRRSRGWQRGGAGMAQ